MKNLVNTLGATFVTQSSSNLLRMFVLMVSQTILIMVRTGSNNRSLGQISEISCYTLRATFVAASSSNLFRMFVLMTVKFDHGLIAVNMIGHTIKS